VCDAAAWTMEVMMVIVDDDYYFMDVVDDDGVEIAGV
jgi:hypothetical protein